VKSLHGMGRCFNGDRWQFVPEEDFTPVDKVVLDDDWVAIEGMPVDPVVGPRWNWVLRDISPAEVRTYAIEHGWTTFAVMVRTIGELLDGEVKAIQLRKTDEANHALESMYEMQYIPGRRGWQGEEL